MTNTESKHWIGLMSGTSMDGVDGVLTCFDADGRPRVQAHASAEFPPELRAELLALNQSGADEIHRAALASNALARIYAQVVQALLMQSNRCAADIAAIGAHGQTIRHRPGAFDGTGYTVQLNQPALLAELCGVDVVADFRSRDVAAGGQGAPLAPAFHVALFAQADRAVSVLNLGGIANLSLLPAGADLNSPGIRGFDCGPGNALLDHWCQQHLGQPYDAGGAWAAQGSVLPELLIRFLAEPYFAQAIPKSTGRDLFHPAWLQTHLDAAGGSPRPQDVQATLAELTVSACATHLLRYQAQSVELIVCGGGAFNTHLMRRLSTLLPNVTVLSSAERGLPPQQVEATAFAWLAQRALQRQAGNLPGVTGAQGVRILGAVYPA